MTATARGQADCASCSAAGAALLASAHQVRAAAVGGPPANPAHAEAAGAAFVALGVLGTELQLFATELRMASRRGSGTREAARVGRARARLRRVAARLDERLGALALPAAAGDDPAAGDDGTCSG